MAGRIINIGVDVSNAFRFCLALPLCRGLSHDGRCSLCRGLSHEGRRCIKCFLFLSGFTAVPWPQPRWALLFVPWPQPRWALLLRRQLMFQPSSAGELTPGHLVLMATGVVDSCTISFSFIVSVMPQPCSAGVQCTQSSRARGFSPHAR
jgi:hypothetical protein